MGSFCVRLWGLFTGALVLFVALLVGSLQSDYAKWTLRSFLNIAWRWSCVDRRACRQFFHSFPGYGPYREDTKSWPAIDRRAFDSITAEEFRKIYVEQRTPVILTGLRSTGAAFNPERLERECADVQLHFDARYAAGLKKIPRFVRKLMLDPRLKHTYGLGTEDVLQAMSTRRSIKSYLSGLDNDAKILALARSRSEDHYKGSIADYTFPVMPSAHNLTHCHSLAVEAADLFSKLIHMLAEDDPVVTLKKVKAVLFVGPAGSRAIPLHQHGPFNDNLLLMLHGKKRVVVTTATSASQLYERPEFGGSEYADRVFSAEILRPDLAKQPNLRQVRAAEGILSPGDLIYIPVNMPHAVETTQDSHSVMLAWQVSVPGIPTLLHMANCSHLEELSDHPPWEEKCRMLERVAQSRGM